MNLRSYKALGMLRGLLLLFALAGCRANEHNSALPATNTPPAHETSQELVVFTPSGGRLIFESVELFMEARGLTYDVKVLEGMSTELVMEGLREGTVDLVFMHRRPRPDEGVAFYELAYANVAIFAHPDVGVDTLSREQIAAIFSGEVTNWSQVGGADQDIVVFILPEYDSVTVALRNLALGDSAFSSSAYITPDETSVLLSAIGIPGGVGCATWATKKYVDLSRVAGEGRAFHTISIEGVAINDPGYPMGIVVGFGYLPAREEFLKPLFDWFDDFLVSPQGQFFLQMFEVQSLSRN
jgi:phosphate transport system substrate-binding protein